MNEYSQFEQQISPETSIIPSPQGEGQISRPRPSISWGKINPLWWYVPTAFLCLLAIVWSIQKGGEVSVETVPTSQSEQAQAQDSETADTIISEQVDADAASIGAAARIVIERESSALFQRQVSDTYASMLRSMENKNFAVGAGTKPRMVSCFGAKVSQCASKIQAVLEQEYKVYLRLNNSGKLAIVNNQMEVLVSIRKGEVSRTEFNPSTLLLARKAESEAIESLQEETTEGKAARALKAKQQVDSGGDIRGGKL